MFADYICPLAGQIADMRLPSSARLSPDAFIQMALQLAWYRMRGEFTATYETALTRLFKHGRTETIRTLSTDSRAWVLAMADSQCPVRPRCTFRLIPLSWKLTRHVPADDAEHDPS